MAQRSKEGHIAFLLIVGLVGWFVPGGGHLVINEKKHAIIIFATIALTFATGLYIGSIGSYQSRRSKALVRRPAYELAGSGGPGPYDHRTGDYPVYGRPSEIGQIYTSIAGLLNLLCIVNAVYWAHLRRTGDAGE